MSLVSYGSLWSQKGVRISKAKASYCCDETNKEILHLSGVPVKLCFTSTRAAYFEMRSIKDKQDRNSRTVKEPERAADYISSV
jgi:hypothetical protein